MYPEEAHSSTKNMAEIIIVAHERQQKSHGTAGEVGRQCVHGGRVLVTGNGQPVYIRYVTNVRQQLAGRQQCALSAVVYGCYAKNNGEENVIQANRTKAAQNACARCSAVNQAERLSVAEEPRGMTTCCRRTAQKYGRGYVLREPATRTAGVGLHVIRIQHGAYNGIRCPCRYVRRGVEKNLPVAVKYGKVSRSARQRVEEQARRTHR